MRRFMDPAEGRISLLMRGRNKGLLYDESNPESKVMSSLPAVKRNHRADASRGFLCKRP